MDISMPIMDGYEATEKIRELENSLDLPSKNRSFIVGLTAHSTETYINKCFNSGMSQCLIKPVDHEKLHKLLVNLSLAPNN